MRDRAPSTPVNLSRPHVPRNGRWHISRPDPAPLTVLLVVFVFFGALGERYPSSEAWPTFVVWLVFACLVAGGLALYLIIIALIPGRKISKELDESLKHPGEVPKAARGSWSPLYFRKARVRRWLRSRGTYRFLPSDLTYRIGFMPVLETGEEPILPLMYALVAPASVIRGLPAELPDSAHATWGHYRATLLASDRALRWIYDSDPVPGVDPPAERVQDEPRALPYVGVGDLTIERGPRSQRLPPAANLLVVRDRTYGDLAFCLYGPGVIGPGLPWGRASKPAGNVLGWLAEHIADARGTDVSGSHAPSFEGDVSPSYADASVVADPTRAEEEDALRGYARRGARVGLITAVLTGLLLPFAIRGLVDNLHLRARGVAATASVTSLSCHEESHTVRCGGAVTFRTADGTDVTASFSVPKSSLDLTDPDHPTMRVVYDPDQPSNVAFRSTAVGAFDIVFFSLLCTALTLVVVWGITLGPRRRRWESRVRERMSLGPRVAATAKGAEGRVSLEQAGGSDRFSMRVIPRQAVPSTRRSAHVIGDLSGGGIVVVEFEGRTIWPSGRLHRGWFGRVLTGFNFQRGTTFVD